MRGCREYLPPPVLLKGGNYPVGLLPGWKAGMLWCLRRTLAMDARRDVSSSTVRPSPRITLARFVM